MTLIDYKKLIYELKDESFEELKGYLGDYFPVYFIDDAEMTRSMLLEKIGDFLLRLQYNKNLKDSQMPKKYCDLLLKYINYRYVGDKNNKTIASKLYDRAESIKNKLDKCKTIDELHQNLLDFSKIFLVFYDKYMKDKLPISDVSFSVSDICLKKLMDFLSDDKPPINPVVHQIADLAADVLKKVVPKGSVDVAAEVTDEVTGKISTIQIPKIGKSQNNVNEPIYQYVVSMKEDNPASLKTFAAILLTIMFVANKEYETTIEE